MSEDIRYMKLSSGEDIVAMVLAETSQVFEVTNVLVVKQTFDQKTRTLYSGFYIWIPFKDYLSATSKIPNTNVMVATPVTGNMLNAYYNYIDYVNKSMPDNEFDEEGPMDMNEGDDEEEEQIVVSSEDSGIDLNAPNEGKRRLH